jgi:hypothetical protein
MFGYSIGFCSAETSLNLGLPLGLTILGVAERFFSVSVLAMVLAEKSVAYSRNSNIFKSRLRSLRLRRRETYYVNVNDLIFLTSHYRD